MTLLFNLGISFNFPQTNKTLWSSLLQNRKIHVIIPHRHQLHMEELTKPSEREASATIMTNQILVQDISWSILHFYHFLFKKPLTQCKDDFFHQTLKVVPALSQGIFSVRSVEGFPQWAGVWTQCFQMLNSTCCSFADEQTHPRTEGSPPPRESCWNTLTWSPRGHWR